LIYQYIIKFIELPTDWSHDQGPRPWSWLQSVYL